MQYRWKLGARAPVSAQVAGEVCERLSSEGRLTSHDLVDESRDESAPLHKCFEWNDTIAAERYRETQASYIIRSIETVLQDDTEPVRAFVSITVGEKAMPYAAVEHVMMRSDSRATLLMKARAELEAFKRKYQQLAELADVFAAIDGLDAA